MPWNLAVEGWPVTLPCMVEFDLPISTLIPVPRDANDDCRAEICFDEGEDGPGMQFAVQCLPKPGLSYLFSPLHPGLFLEHRSRHRALPFFGWNLEGFWPAFLKLFHAR